MLKSVAMGSVLLALLLAGCGGSDQQAVTPPAEVPEPASPAEPPPPTEPAPQSEPALDACSNSDGALTDAAFILVTSPKIGERVTTGFAVEGCSRTFESNVPWRLVDRTGAELASGFTSGGGVDGFGPFSFTVEYSVVERQIGHLEVIEEDASGGEGFPPVRNVIPLVLEP